MGVATLISLEEYLSTSYRPDRDYLEGEVIERNVGKRKHGYAQAEIATWFGSRKRQLHLQPLTELRLQVTPTRVRIPDLVIARIPIPDEEVFTHPPYLCIEIMSPDDTMANLQDRLDDYLAFGVPNIWVIDPWKFRGWTITPAGWSTTPDQIMRTADNSLAMPLADVLLP
ncbi:MAG: Uma2 family endonuclease [Acidobacteriia bacterium]|nr:Uma2 family endonuclease [Terriglobia bacterium]